MPVALGEGCFVSGLTEGEPERYPGLKVWRRADTTTGTSALSLRVLEFAAGLSPGLTNSAVDEVLYVLSGQATVYLDGWPQRVEPETGFYLKPGVCLTVENDGPEPLTVVSSRCPDPGPAPFVVDACTQPIGSSLSPRPFVRLADAAAEVTGDRWYRVLVDARAGCDQVTQFVGAIPPGRAPDHYHAYEEMLCILKGEGRMWARDASAPIGAGSCIYLPRGLLHCVENKGPGELRLLGVFYPAGSPAVRYPATAAAPRD